MFSFSAEVRTAYESIPVPLNAHIFKFKKRVGNNLSQEQIHRTLTWVNTEEE